MEKINNVYCIAGMMADSNCYLIDNSENDSDFDYILVDTGVGGSGDYFSSQLSEIGLSMEDIDLVVNTHCHYDHVGGNYLFPNAKIAIGTIDGDSLEDPESPIPICFVPTREIKRRDVDIRLKEGDRIADFEVLETPGHTAGGISLFDGSILISGDTIFSHGGVGRMDIGGNMEDMKNSHWTNYQNLMLNICFQVMVHGFPMLMSILKCLLAVFTFKKR